MQTYPEYHENHHFHLSGAKAGRLPDPIGPTLIDLSAFRPFPEVDPDHYKLIFENEKVRVVRITYGTGEKSVMHYHPDAVAVMMTDNISTFTLPDGEVIEISAEHGDAVWTPAGEHLPQNVGDKPVEVILVELKEKPESKD